MEEYNTYTRVKSDEWDVSATLVQLQLVLFSYSRDSPVALYLTTITEHVHVAVSTSRTNIPIFLIISNRRTSVI